LISGNGILKSYQVPLNTLQHTGKAVLAIVSGFYHPENNSNGQALGLYLIPAEGGAYIPLLDVTGTSEIQNDDNIKIYPNPAYDFIEVSVNNLAGPMILELYSLEGKKIWSKNWHIAFAAKEKFDVSELPWGMYFVRIITDNSVTIKKLQITK
ncbi:MAG TPA: T9SS type A sorting domain-containing protein, partial [Bacteroidales bacterium]|nr:T9SS type A sorting domain-containing protein [Bacteroidales bacterium]